MDKTILKQLLVSVRTKNGLSGFCQNLLFGPLQEADVVGVWIAKITASAELQIVGECNVLGFKLLGTSVSLLGETPLSLAVRTKRIQHAGKLPDDWIEGTVASFGYCYSAFPIQEDMVLRGAMMLGHSQPTKARKFVEEFCEILETLSVLSLYLSDPHSKETSVTTHIQEELNERQLNVMSGIIEGQTNFQIARMLNVSESTIKQETIRIYRFLNVNNRRDAGKLAIERGLVPRKGKSALAHA